MTAEEIRARLDAIREKAGGSLSYVSDPGEQQEVRSLHAKLKKLENEPDHKVPFPGATRQLKRDAAVLTKNQSIADWTRAKGIGRADQELNLGKYVRGIVTGEWEGADAERKAMSESVLGDGGHLVPTPLSAQVIDLARNQARVMEAGASTVPMDSSTLKIARQTGDPSGAWHEENVADIPDSGVSLDAVTLTARTLTALVKFSRELFEDAPNLQERVSGSIAQALALELDSKALYGDNSVNPQEPTGLRNTSGITVQTLGAPDGAVPADFDFLLDAYFALQDVNFTPTGAIDSPRTERTLAGLKDTTNQPLQPPQAVSSVPRYSTNQVPVNLTTGANNDTSDLYAGAWSELMIGMRTQLKIQFLAERFAESGTLAMLAWLRADVQVARPDGFVIVEGIRA